MRIPILALLLNMGHVSLEISWSSKRIPAVNLRFNLPVHDIGVELLTRQNHRIDPRIRMVGYLNACVRASEPGPVGYGRHCMDDPLWELCKRRPGVRGD